MPEISVLMPMRNAQAYVRQAVASVLSQTGVALELLVIDDGSSDRSFEMIDGIKDDRIRLFRNPGRGIYAALNFGLEQAEGKYVARCDSDDLYAQDRLRHQYDWLTTHPEFSAICGGFAAIDPRAELCVNLMRGADHGEEITEELRNGVTRTSLCTFLCDIECARRIGGFREFFVTAGDIDFQLRLGETARVWFDPQTVYFYRVHGESVTHQQAEALREFYEEMAREFQRQRRRQGSDDLQRNCPPSPPTHVVSRPSSAKAQFCTYLVGSTWEAYKAGEIREAFRLAISACRLQPFVFQPWRNLMVLIVKFLLSRFIRRS